MWIHESIMALLYYSFKRDSAVPSPLGALPSSVPSSAIHSCPTTVIKELITLQNRVQHHFQPLARESILQPSLKQELRRLCRHGDPSYSFRDFRHFRTLRKQIIHVVRQGFYILKLEVGSKIVVIREILNSQILQNRLFAKIFVVEYFPAYGILLYLHVLVHTYVDVHIYIHMYLYNHIGNFSVVNNHNYSN